MFPISLYTKIISEDFVFRFLKGAYSLLADSLSSDAFDNEKEKYWSRDHFEVVQLGVYISSRYLFVCYSGILVPLMWSLFLVSGSSWYLHFTVRISNEFYSEGPL